WWSRARLAGRSTCSASIGWREIGRRQEEIERQRQLPLSFNLFLSAPASALEQLQLLDPRRQAIRRRDIDDAVDEPRADDLPDDVEVERRLRHVARQGLVGA